MRCCDQVRAQAAAVILHKQIAHGDRGHVDLERLPMISVVVREPHLRIRRRIEEALLSRIFANGIRDRTGCDSRVNLGPAFSAIVRPPEMRIHIIQAQRVRGCIGGTVVEVPGVDVEDARPRLDLWRRDVAPLRAAIHGHLYVAVIGARPNDADISRRRRQRRDRPLRTRRHGARVLSSGRGHRPALTREIRADARPAVSAIHCLPNGIRCVKEQVGIERRPVDRHGAHVAIVACSTLGGVGTDIRDLPGLSIVE